jgi:hypothetical protein
MTISDTGVDALLIIRADAGERDDGTINLIEKRTDLRAVVNIVGGQRPATIWPVSASTPMCIYATTCAGSCHASRPVLARILSDNGAAPCPP